MAFFCQSGSFCCFHCIPGCLHSLETSFSLVVYQMQELFLKKRCGGGGGEENLWNFNLPHPSLGAGELQKLIGKHSLHSIMAFSEDPVIALGQTKSQITSTLSLAAR